VGILEGAICNSHNVEVAKRMRERCQILIAVGDCATFGGVPAMRNLVGTEAALNRAYLETESVVEGVIPDSPDRSFFDTHPVDLFIPGCPPRADAFFYALSELLAGRTPVVLPPELFTYD
jgi:NAD-reducing hydrogenase small subunit